MNERTAATGVASPTTQGVAQPPAPSGPLADRAPVADPPLTREQVLVTIGIMAALAVTALDSTVVGTAMPTIIGQLGGISEYGWVFSAYLLTSTTTVPLYSRVADMIGRKPVFLVGLAFFVGGSALCGLSGSMAQLIVFRAIQGLGAGAVQPICFTIAGDIFDIRRRARMQGFFSSVWGVSAIVGPVIGGVITSTIGWPWVFEVNIPVGIVAAIIIGRVFHERFERRRHRLDVFGALLLTSGIAVLLVAVSEGGNLLGWTSPLLFALLAIALGLLAAFVVFERRTAEPLIDLDLLRNRLVAAGLAIQVASGVVLFGVTTYVPPMVQGVHGGTPLMAGIAVGAMSLGWPLGSILGGRALLRFGARRVVLVGTGMLVAGTAILTQTDPFPGLAVPIAGASLVGFGLGLSATLIMVVIQGAVPWHRRGVATGLIQFSRTIGGSVGVGIMGGILTLFVSGASSGILDPTGASHLSADQLATARTALGNGLSLIYWIFLAAALVAAAVAIRAMPDVRIAPPGRQVAGSGGGDASADRDPGRGGGGA